MAFGPIVLDPVAHLPYFTCAFDGYVNCRGHWRGMRCCNE
jgi:hypothetical protein